MLTVNRISDTKSKYMISYDLHFKFNRHIIIATNAIEKDPSAASKWLSYKSFIYITTISSLENMKNMHYSLALRTGYLYAISKQCFYKIMSMCVSVDVLLLRRKVISSKIHTFKLHGPFFDRIHFHGVQIAQIIVSLLVRCSHLERCEASRGVTSSKCWIWPTCKSKTKRLANSKQSKLK